MEIGNGRRCWPVVLLFLSSTASAQTLRDADYQAAATPGLDLAFKLQHTEAIAYFEELEKRYPHHPGPPLSRAISIWLRELIRQDELDLERFLMPGYFTGPSRGEMAEDERHAFFDAVAEGRERAEAYLREHPGDLDARYYLGSVEGALGVFAFTVDRELRTAMKHGKESYRIQQSVVEEDPDFVDAYITLGSYEYVVGNLPWYLKWIASLAGYRGSETRGFEYLARTAREGYLRRNDARVLLMVMYVRENELEYALEVARQLHRRYPENFLLHVNRAQILERMNEPERAASTYAAVVERARAKTPNYDMLPLDRLRYPLGERLFELGSKERALALFRRAADDSETPARQRALSNLRAGEILGAMGRHDEAEAHFRRVQELEEFDDSHMRAERFLQALDEQQ